MTAATRLCARLVGAITALATVTATAQSAHDAIDGGSEAVTSASEAADDALAQRVHDRLKRDTLLNDDPIAIHMQDGVVTLLGTVDTAAQRDHAERLTRSVTGVVGVENLLDIAPDSGVDRGMDLFDRVVRQLEVNPHVDAASVDVAVQGDTVILSGEVASVGAYRAAEQSAMQAGANRVINKIRIRTDGLRRG